MSLIIESLVDLMGPVGLAAVVQGAEFLAKDEVVAGGGIFDSLMSKITGSKAAPLSEDEAAKLKERAIESLPALAGVPDELFRAELAKDGSAVVVRFLASRLTKSAEPERTFEFLSKISFVIAQALDSKRWEKCVEVGKDVGVVQVPQPVAVADPQPEV